MVDARASAKRDSMCRPCRAAYGRDHYEANKERYVERAAERKRELRLIRTQFLIAYFENHPCVDCGERDPVVLEFDHLRDKSFSIGTKLSHRAWVSILAEIEKCEVVCANCHRRRTALRRGSVRAVLAAQQQRSVERAGDQNRTGPKTLEGSCATTTPRPREGG